MNVKEVKEIAKKVWHFLWHDDSLLSWVANIAVAFLLIKFVIYPGFGFVFGTNFPIVAVVSGSMEHDGSFDDWWNSQAICGSKFICTQAEFYESNSISKIEFLDFDFKNGFNTGDIMVLFGADPGEVEVGHVIVFSSTTGEPIIHRVFNATEHNGNHIYMTKGDHNANPISGGTLNELNVHHDRVLGKAVFRVPYLGWVKIGFFKMISWVGGLFV